MASGQTTGSHLFSAGSLLYAHERLWIYLLAPHDREATLWPAESPGGARCCPAVLCRAHSHAVGWVVIGSHRGASLAHGAADDRGRSRARPECRDAKQRCSSGISAVRRGGGLVRLPPLFLGSANELAHRSSSSGR